MASVHCRAMSSHCTLRGGKAPEVFCVLADSKSATQDACEGLCSLPSAHLPLRCLCQLPAVGLQVVQLIELHADVFNGQLQEIPKPCQVLGCGSGIGIRVLERKAQLSERRHPPDGHSSPHSFTPVKPTCLAAARSGTPPQGTPALPLQNHGAIISSPSPGSRAPACISALGAPRACGRKQKLPGLPQQHSAHSSSPRGRSPTPDCSLTHRAWFQGGEGWEWTQQDAGTALALACQCRATQRPHPPQTHPRASALLRPGWDMLSS